MGCMKATSYLFVQPRIFLFSYKIIRYNILAHKSHTLHPQRERLQDLYVTNTHNDYGTW
jgi:hypothetical protein